MEQLKKQSFIPRTIAVVFSILIVIVMIFMLILILNEIGGGLLGGAILFGAADIVLLWQLTDYHKNFISPLLKSVDSKLSSPSAKEAYASQILGNQKQRFTYGGAPQSNLSIALIMPDYSYFRLFRNSCVMINAPIRRAVSIKYSG